MLSAFFRPAVNRRRQKKILFDLLAEINTNLECFYVIDQRQFISRGLDLEVWEDAKEFSGITFSQEMQAYAAALADFNRLFASMRAFEEMYSSSIDNKTRANAEILHARKEALEENIKAVQPHILTAQKIIRALLEPA